MANLLKTGALTSVSSLNDEEKESNQGERGGNSNGGNLETVKRTEFDIHNENLYVSNLSPLKEVVMPVAVKHRGKPSGMAITITHVSTATRNKKKNPQRMTDIEMERNQVLKGT